MLVEEYEYTCARCGAVFTAPASVHGYGRLLLRSGSGRLALVDADTDPAWADAERLVARITTYTGLRDHQRGDVFQRGIVPILYDRDEEQYEFELGAPPRCPSCGSRTMADWRSLNPARLVELELPPPRSEAWFRLTEDERLRALREAVVDALST